MSEHKIDPDLVGIWLLPGQPQTYEIYENGDYLIGEPEESLRFEDADNRMIWGDRRFRRSGDHGVGLIGTWLEEDTGDAWDFTEDQAVTILTEDETLITGIWALRDQGHSLWHCEKRASVTSDGAHVEFSFVSGETARYGYTVKADVLCLLDPENWTELTRYLNSNLYLESVAS
ncbi:hypothetical protein HKCCE4037_06885 [Rhodobacterales bacterium HKCCE4037]|nr:hypothetical protein [Rhodobacterales bacterium HKCCE4037]